MTQLIQLGAAQPMVIVPADHPVQNGTALPVHIVGTSVELGGGSGTTDHAELDNLDYASSGHTGFAAETDLMIVANDDYYYAMHSKQIKGAGQITVTNGSDQVVGTGTEFIGDEGESTLSYWYAFYVNGVSAECDSIEDDTHATLTEPWSGATQTVDLVYDGAFALDNSTIAIGSGTLASGANATAIGIINKVSADTGVAVGGYNVVSGEGSVAVGNLNEMPSPHRFAVGEGLSTENTQVAVGAYNEDRDVTFAVGYGTYINDRKNAFEASPDMTRTPEKRTIASPTTTGVVGERCWDDTYEYRCVDTDTWERWTRTSSW